MLQWGLVLPSLPIPSPPTLSLAVLVWEELLAWQQARSFVPRIRSRWECLVGSTFAWIPLTRARFASFRPSLMDFFCLATAASWPLPRAGQALPSQRLWLPGTDTARRAADDVSWIWLGWVKWLNVLPVPGRYSLGKLCLPSLCLPPIPVPPIPTKHWAPPGLGVSAFPPLLRRAGTVLSTWANADTQ